MPHRTVKYVSAIVCLAGSLAMASSVNTSANAANECLSGPKGTTPGGKHWYYRIDRSTKKHCWYLGDEGTRTSRAANAKPVESVTATAAQADTAPDDLAAQPLEPSVANARAEFPPVNTAPPSQQQTVQPSETSPDTATANEDTRRFTERDLMTQQPMTLASRWPLPNEFQPTQTQAQSDSREAAAPNATAQSPMESIKQQNPGLSLSTGINTRIGPLQIFLCVLAIALALAAILARAIFRYAANARRKQTAYIQRRPIWPDEMPHGAVRPSYAQMVTPERRARAMRQDRPSREVTDEIEQLLRGVSRRHG